MGLIQDLIAKYRGRGEKERGYEEDYRIQKKLSEKQLSSNERELNRFTEEERQKRINIALEHYRKRKLREWWVGHQVIHQQNLFANKRNIFANQKKLFSK